MQAARAQSYLLRGVVFFPKTESTGFCYTWPSRIELPTAIAARRPLGDQYTPIIEFHGERPSCVLLPKKHLRGDADDPNQPVRPCRD